VVEVDFAINYENSKVLCNQMGYIFIKNNNWNKNVEILNVKIWAEKSTHAIQKSTTVFTLKLQTLMQQF